MEELPKLRDENYRGVYLTTAQIINYYNLQNFPKPAILKTKEYVQMITFTIYFQKYSCLLRTFDRNIAAFVTNGLIHYWDEQFTKIIDQIEDPEPKQLNIDQIAGVIEICAVLYALSVLVFIMEIMASHHEAIKKIIDFFTFK